MKICASSPPPIFTPLLPAAFLSLFLHFILYTIEGILWCLPLSESLHLLCTLASSVVT